MNNIPKPSGLITAHMLDRNNFYSDTIDAWEHKGYLDIVATQRPKDNSELTKTLTFTIGTSLANGNYTYLSGKEFLVSYVEKENGNPIFRPPSQEGTFSIDLDHTNNTYGLFFDISFKDLESDKIFRIWSGGFFTGRNTPKE